MRAHRVTGRSIAAVVALLAAGGISVALADPPAAPDATPPAASATSTAVAAPSAAPTAANATASANAAAKPVSAASSEAESQAALEKRLTNSGYKPKMRNGTKVWCKRQDETGSHLGAVEVCGTSDELMHSIKRNQDFVEQIQKGALSNNPTGK